MKSKSKYRISLIVHQGKGKWSEYFSEIKGDAYARLQIAFTIRHYVSNGYWFVVSFDRLVPDQSMPRYRTLAKIEHREDGEIYLDDNLCPSTIVEFIKNTRDYSLEDLGRLIDIKANPKRNATYKKYIDPPGFDRPRSAQVRNHPDNLRQD